MICGTGWYDMTYDTIWYDIETLSYDTIWYDMIWYDVMWYDMILTTGVIWYGTDNWCISTSTAVGVGYRRCSHFPESSPRVTSRKTAYKKRLVGKTKQNNMHTCTAAPQYRSTAVPVPKGSEGGLEVDTANYLTGEHSNPDQIRGV